MAETHFDALVVGAGFAGIYQLYSLLKLGLKVKAIERGEGAGGVWLWNNYPGAMTDTESFLYRYSFDSEDLQTYPWANNYLTRDEVVDYLNHVIDKHHLRDHCQFSTEMVCAEWHQDTGKWHVQTDNGDSLVTIYLFTALGIQSTPNLPEFSGLSRFGGPVMHSAAWDQSTDVVGKRVAIIGSGSSGIQLTTALAPKVAELHNFIRSPQYSVPLRLKPISADERLDINLRYDDIWAAQFDSRTAFGFEEPATLTMSMTAEERSRVFEELWQKGNGFRFMFGGFGDLASNIKANDEACSFLRGKITSIVKDPAKAEILTPTELFARRPACDQGYFEKFNQDNVFPVDLRKTPITGFEPEGIRTSDGKLRKLDIVVLATGYRSGEGSYKTVKGGIKGRDGVMLGEHWDNGIKTYLSMFVPLFPNLFMVNGPQGPFSNAPTLIEAEVDFLTKLVSELRGPNGTNVIECTTAAEEEWVRLCDHLADSETLFNKVDSWLTGKNISGAKHSTKFYYGGLKSYRAVLEDVKKSNYRGLLVS